MMLCVQLGVGFAKRNEGMGVLHNWADLSNEQEEEVEEQDRHPIETENKCPDRPTARNGGRLRYG